MPKNDSWIETFTGRKFYPLTPAISDIDIEDIAHALSLICRFNGHTRYFYSVAQHSLGVQEEMERHGYNAEWQLMGLLHDASEAYISDITRPIKPYLINYKDIEQKLQDEIFERFNLTPLSKLPDEISSTIKYFDDMQLGAEARTLMNNADHWADRLRPAKTHIRWEDPETVEKRFVKKFHGLVERRKQADSP